MDITTRSVFMVGGTSGIGLELARRLRAVGSTVVVGGRRTDVLAQLADEGLGIVEIDVTDADSVARAVARARDEVLRAHADLDTVVTRRNHHAVGMGAISEGATAAPGYNSIRPKSTAPLAEMSPATTVLATCSPGSTSERMRTRSSRP